MPNEPTGRPNRALNAVAAALLILWATGAALWALVATLAGGSQFGFSVPDVGRGRITVVTRRSAADDAGLRPGDRIVVRDLTPAERELLAHYSAYKAPGTRLDITVERDGDLRNVSLRSRLPADKLVLESCGLVVTLVFVGVAGALAILRPNRVTWPFMLLSVGYVISEYGGIPPANATLATIDNLSIALSVGVTIWASGWFIIAFPEGSHTRYDGAFRGLVVVGAAALTLFEYLASTVPYYSVVGIVIAGLTAIAIVRFVSGGGDRSRTLWVLVGLVVAFLGVGLHALMSALDPDGFPSSIAGGALSLVPVTLPLAVAYAVLRHRVIDVRFALNRALVFGMLTSALVLFFSFVEWVIGKKLESTRLAFYVDLATALAIGFWFNAMHQRVERIVESALFRKQHRAEERLERVVRAIPHAAAAQTVDSFLADDPAGAYELESAAVFRRSDDGTAFARVNGIGWGAADLASLPEAEPLVAHLASRDEPLALDDVRRLPGGQYPAGNRQPILAVPISSRARLIGFALYGAHTSGEAINPDERALLHRLATAAAAAYDHLEAEDLRRQIERLRAPALTDAR